MSDDYHERLSLVRQEEFRDKYVQFVIETLDDPDYKGMPLVVDPLSGMLLSPASFTKKIWLRSLSWAKGFVKKYVSDDEDDYDVH